MKKRGGNSDTLNLTKNGRGDPKREPNIGNAPLPNAISRRPLRFQWDSHQSRLVKLPIYAADGYNRKEQQQRLVRGGDKSETAIIAGGVFIHGIHEQTNATGL